MGSKAAAQDVSHADSSDAVLRKHKKMGDEQRLLIKTPYYKYTLQTSKKCICVIYHNNNNNLLIKEMVECENN